jgi:hypothetical protein
VRAAVRALALAVPLVGLGCAAGLRGPAVPADAALFAVWTGLADPGGAVPFLGYWTPDGFVDLSGREGALAAVLARFRPGARFEGTSEDGAPVRLVVADVDPSRSAGVVGEPVRFRVEQAAGDPAQRSILVHPPGPRVEVLTPRIAALSADGDAELRRRAEALFRRALPSRPARERFDAIELGVPVVEGVEVSQEVVAVLYPATLVQHVGRDEAVRDERGVAFFLFDAARGTVLLESFGHPEWSGRTDASSVLTLQPIAWVRVGDDPTVHLFALRQQGDGRLGWALVDLATGRSELRTP